MAWTWSGPRSPSRRWRARPSTGCVALIERAVDVLASVLPAVSRRCGRATWRRGQMKKLSAGRLAFAARPGRAPRRRSDKVTLQLKWVTQAQFAGYYVAKDKGFYKEAGLDVTIKPGGPDIAPPQVIAGGGADVVVDWMPSAPRRAREGRAAGQHRPALQALRHDADLPQGDRHQDAGRLQGPDARRLVLRQRISVPRPGWQARHPDRRRRRTASRC